jgi:tetratricopeptide (TPR) repeat protein
MLIGSRYNLENKLGAGGMGVVYRATDRLTGQAVALKQVRVAPDQLAFGSRDDTTDLRVALAREFQTLASLRHPNIINVLDYGFDSQRQPYFTMTLLDQPQDIVQAGRASKNHLILITQVLQALAYLHRKNIIHRDLKPGNVLIAANGEVKVLDFGLAMGTQSIKDVQQSAAGTLSYMAPELFAETAPSVQSDLYAVGIILYELVKGRHPFPTGNISQLMYSILYATPDLADIPPNAADVLKRLLAKSPGDRYADADAVIAALYEAYGRAVPLETAAVRESFLQAARFIGRDVEMGLLMAALNAIVQPAASPDKPAEHIKTQAAAADEGDHSQNPAYAGEGDLEKGSQGSAWLVGGESGVGKSRLLDELRIRGLVKGVLVLRGQAVAEGGQPYQMWREVVRRLALSTEISDFDLSILKEIAPDIGSLLQREIPNAPVIEGAPGQQRLVQTLIAAFRKQTQPSLLILEDLQWSGESLSVLQQLVRIVSELPILIVANYRDDESPDLPQKLAGMQTLKLNRLPENHIRELSASMLGEAGEHPNVVNLLNRETEGNIFFLVEVVRALAEEAGSLSEIGHKSLPERVVAGGIQQIIRRRLNRATAEALPLLKLAAVAGRELDLTVLEAALVGTMAFEDWLTACANAAVLEVNAEKWRFAHDKLREVLVSDLSSDERIEMNRQVAEALESVYPGDKSRAAALVEHWHSAGDVDKTAQYSDLAARQALTISQFSETLRLCERALNLLQTDDSRRMTLFNMAAEAQTRLGDLPKGEALYQSALELARQVRDVTQEQSALRGLSITAMSQGNYSLSEEHARANLAIAREHNDRRSMAYSFNTLSSTAIYQGKHAEARKYLEDSLVMLRELDDRRALAATLHNLGYLLYTEGDNEGARKFFEDSQEITRAIGDRNLFAQSSLMLGMAAYTQADYATAERWARESLTVQQDIGNRYGQSETLNILGWVAENRGDYDVAQDYYDRGLAINQQIGNRQGIGYSLNNQAGLARKRGKYDTAKALAEKAVAEFRAISDRRGLGYSLNVAALAAYSLENYQQGIKYGEEALQVAQENGDRYLQVGCRVSLTVLQLALENAEAARQHLRDGIRTAREVSAHSILLELMTQAAALRLAEKKPERAAELVGMIGAQPLSANSDVQEWLKLIRPDLEAALSAEALSAAIERGKQLDMAAVCSELLG